jgi:transforming growth factor-beta-induced protein
MPPKKETPNPATPKGAPVSDGDAGKRTSRATGERTSSRSRVHEHDLVTTAEGSGRLKIFVDLVRAAGLTDLLRSEGPYTVFAPTDRAFDRMPPRELDALMADSTRLAEVLGHHVVEGRVKAPQPETPRTATPMNGAELRLTSRVDAYHVNEARLVQTNIRASNGVIHAIDKLLVLA